MIRQPRLSPNRSWPRIRGLPILLLCSSAVLSACASFGAAPNLLNLQQQAVQLRSQTRLQQFDSPELTSAERELDRLLPPSEPWRPNIGVKRSLQRVQLWLQIAEAEFELAQVQGEIDQIAAQQQQAALAAQGQ